MSGIYQSDKFLSYYQGLRKCVRWYKKIVFHSIEMFEHNSFYLFKQTNPQNKITLVKFCTEVVKRLLDHEKLSQTEQRGSTNAHYPKLIPSSEKKKNLTLHCKHCYKSGQRLETRYQCVQCEGKPALCVDLCFMLFHEN